MRYRRFGRTRLEFPVISCGGMRFQHDWNDVPTSRIPGKGQANVEAIVQRAIELGINHFETARGYGSSEMQLGLILPKLPREQLIVQTKVPPTATAEEFLKTFDKSMSYLKLDYVDLLAVHGVNNRERLDWTLNKGGVLQALRQIRDDGRARFIGFSTHAGNDVTLEAIRSDEFDYVNLHWYFVNQLNWASVEAAAARDMGVLIISPNDKGGKLYEPPQKLVDLCQPLTPMQFNGLFCLSRPEVHTLSCGVARPEDFDEHIAALEHYDAIQETVRPILNRILQTMVAEHGEDWCQRWWEGLPTYDQTPGNINIIEILRLWTHATSLDMVEWAKMRYNLLGQADHWFPGNTAAKAGKVSLARCLSASPFADRIPEILVQAHTLLRGKPMQRLSQSVANPARRIASRIRSSFSRD